MPFFEILHVNIIIILRKWHPFFISIIGLMCGAVCIVYYQAALALRGAAAHRASLDLLVIE